MKIVLWLGRQAACGASEMAAPNKGIGRHILARRRAEEWAAGPDVCVCEGLYCCRVPLSRIVRRERSAVT